jgi:small subunit ribosomal protein S19
MSSWEQKIKNYYTMNKCTWKNPYVQKKLFAEFLKVRNNKQTKVIYTSSRNSTIIPMFVGFTFNTYNGKYFVKLLITKKLIGFKLGEFSETRKKFSFKKIKKSHGTKD